MLTTTSFYNAMAKTWIATLAGGLALSFTHVAVAEPHQSPLFLVAQVKPVTMLNMSRDHQLYFKLYDDFSDITDSRPTINNTANANYGKEPDGAPDTTYVHGFDYYGYFDSYKCYTYNTTSNQFNPAAFSANKYCNDGTSVQWSGNFLNWASMTRMDAVRKMLYGGMRSTDTTSETVLERAYLPTDAHSFAKYYGGADLPQLTPFSADISADLQTTGITICNTSDPGTATHSQSATSAVGARPLMRVARGNYSLWASNERYQCRWGSTLSGDDGKNENNAAESLIPAYSDSPIDAHKLGTGSAAGEFVARVAVCVSNLTAMDAAHDNEKCFEYNRTTAQKPRGLLQVHGGTQNFALMTGSYGKNKSGGVLRKGASSISNEINSNGIFQVPSNGNSIIKTLDLLRIYGYRYSEGLYHNDRHEVNTPGASVSDGCKWETSSFANGQCTNWGNPQAEIYLESLRYLSGASSPQFDSDDSSYIAGLNRVATWTDPISTTTTGNYCAPINVLQFDASMTSFDADNLTNAPATIGTISDATNIVGAAEGIHGNSYFVGDNGTNRNQLCTAKEVASLSSVLGACPDAPRLEGSYQIAGLAYKARSAGIAANREKVMTYGVNLAASVPNVVVPVPGSTSGAKVTILPACRNTTPSPAANCAIVDFKIVQQTFTNSTNSGRLYVNWEDTEHGGDYDQDMWGTIDYAVTSTGGVTVTTNVVASSTPNNMGFGYTISGTDNDGFHVQSGIGGYTGGDCSNCNEGDAAAAKTFTVGSSTGSLLQPPLYYAAKWGGYKEDTLTTAEIAAITEVGSYFKATDPRKLEQELDNFFSDFGASGSSATVASNSTRLEDETKVYQAIFNSDDWSGAMRAYPLNTNGTINTTRASWDTDQTLTGASGRRIYTLGDSTVVNLNSAGWAGSTAAALKSALQLSSESTTDNAQKRFNWLMGTDQTGLRQRSKPLGDIVNSDPAYAGPGSQRYNLLPASYGAATYEDYVQAKASRTKAIFVGANDGMMHAFNADTGAELFAYIPRGVYAKLASLTDIDYQHKYTVDGPLYVEDAYIDSNGDGTKEWRTLVGGTLGAGGRGAYLLDVTDTLARGATPRVIFDIHAGDTSLTYSNDLGYSNGKMLIAPAAGDRWVAVLSNGTESNSGTAKLIVIDVQTPSSYKSIATSTATGNGLSGTALLPNSQGISTYAYAGDLKGTMWKFNLDNASIDRWGLSYPDGLITVKDSAGAAQPITGTPTLGRNALKMAGTGSNRAPSVMVYFGTGKYSETTDISSTAVQSIYAIADAGNAISLTNRNTTLLQKSITAETNGVRTVSPDATPVATEIPVVDWSRYSGWYLDLKFGTAASAAKGERVIVKPLLLFDRLIVNTFIPSPNQCDYGGSGWLMQLTGVGDKFIGLNVLLNNANIELQDPILGDLIPIMAGERVFILGSELSGSVEAFVGEAGAGTRGRMSWRQLK
ncbi:pilus assembly protein [Cellvibrio sp. NN19]|uniref:pilus assembly protein n=1 Tax=Cellvibrio chitinivorans TaxID=3102792 RepID=UPI002B409675|nr:PilC/PilY family type IV pilus protein [Cellvibrio sp. NN19]